MASLVFCQCGSDRVDITNWNVNRGRLHCFSCGRELDGFTISEFDPSTLFAGRARRSCAETPAGRPYETLVPPVFLSGWLMRLTGHKTRSVFDRCDIVSEGDMRDDAATLDAARG